MTKPSRKPFDNASERVQFARSLTMWIGCSYLDPEEQSPHPCPECNCGFREAMIGWDYDNPELELGYGGKQRY